MQNIAKTDINSPGIKYVPTRTSPRKATIANHKSSEKSLASVNREIGLSQEYYQHQFDFELVQDGDRRALLARHNLSERFIHRSSNFMD